MQIKEILNKAQKTINLLDAELLLSFVLNKNSAYLFSHNQEELSLKQEKEFEKLAKRRAEKEPIAYILGHKEFYSLDFEVSPCVLIPRPETEQIVDIVLSNAPKDATLIDIGTGSGCIPVACGKNFKFFKKIVAIDISKNALEIAQKNAKKHKIDIQFVHNNLLDNITFPKNTVITANLPYIPESDVLMKDVKDFEPHLALFAGKDGLGLYKNLFEQIENQDFFILVFEADPRQKEAFQVLAEQYFPNKKLKIYNQGRIYKIY